MNEFQLFDSIRLTEALSLETGVTAPIGSPGAVVEMFNNGEAYWWVGDGGGGQRF